jgi:hypothetical protein
VNDESGIGEHPPMPTLEFGACPFIENWHHFCDKPYGHDGKHHCPCGRDFPR